MQSTLISRDADPHDIFVIEPDVVLAARADYAASDPVNAPTAPPIELAPSLAAPASDTTPHAAANDDIQIPRDIHLSGEGPSRGRWAARAIIGFLFALGSAAAAEGWNHYGDTARETAKAMIANWTPSALMSQPAAVADPASAQPAPASGAQNASSQDASSQASETPTAPAPSLTQDVASMGQQIAALKASIEQLKASQDQMAQQMSRDAIKSSAAAPVARTSSAKPSTAPVEPSLRAKVTAALSPRPAAPPPPHKPRPPYPPAQAAAALPPAVSAPPMPPPQPAPYQPRLQAVDPADGDPVVRPPMPVR